MKTKKMILAVLISFSAVATTVAQEMHWGVKAGYNLSSLSGAPESVDVSYRSGFHLGALAEFELSEKFSLHPELLYSMEGGNSSFGFQREGFALSGNEKAKLGYLNLPVMAKYFVTNGLSLEAGPQLGYLLSAEVDFEYTSTIMGEVFTDSGTQDLIDEADRFALGLNFGLGYKLNNNLFVQARYHLGLTSIMEDDPSEDEPVVNLNEIKNKGFQFSLGYKF